MKLIQNAHEFYKFWSVQIMSLILILESFNQFWTEYHSFIPEPYHNYIQTILVIASVIARVIKQSNIKNDYTE